MSLLHHIYCVLTQLLLISISTYTLLELHNRLGVLGTIYSFIPY